MRAAFIRALSRAAEKDSRIMLITGDLGYRYLEPFAEKFPDRYLNIGVAEANLVTVAAGLATTGFIPFVYSIATFASMRAFEQIRNDVSLQNLNVKIVGIGAGFAYTKAGPTHHSVEDIALIRTLPNITVIAPVDTNQAYSATIAAAKHRGPVYLRLGRNPESGVFAKPPPFTIGKGTVISGGKDMAILATGTTVGLAHEIAGKISGVVKSPTIAVFPSIVPLDHALLRTLVRGHRIWVTVEEHRQSGGFGTAVGEWLLTQTGKIPRLVKAGARDAHSQLSAEHKELMKEAGLTTGDVARRIRATLRSQRR